MNGVITIPEIKYNQNSILIYKRILIGTGVSIVIYCPSACEQFSIL